MEETEYELFAGTPLLWHWWRTALDHELEESRAVVNRLSHGLYIAGPVALLIGVTGVVVRRGGLEGVVEVPAEPQLTRPRELRL